MIFNKREEKLIKAFLEVGKLSVDDSQKILGVSQRTAYRVLSELTNSLKQLNIDLIKDHKKYVLAGDLSKLSGLYTLDNYSRSERLSLITRDLLLSDSALTNAYFQERFGVSNVTIIQDINAIEERLQSFDVSLERKQGYLLILDSEKRRYLLAVLLTQCS